MPSAPFYIRWVCALAAAAPACVGSHAAGLQHDLFARPALQALKPEQPQSVKTVAPAPPPPEWKPELKAIITGGGTAMVNVEGRIVQMGQEMDGYRLVGVEERRAIFVRDKVRYTLLLNAVKGADAPAGGVTAGAAPVAGSAVKPGHAQPENEVKASGGPVGLGTLRTSDVLREPGIVQSEAARAPAANPASRVGG